MVLKKSYCKVKSLLAIQENSYQLQGKEKNIPRERTWWGQGGVNFSHHIWWGHLKLRGGDGIRATGFQWWEHGHPQDRVTKEPPRQEPSTWDHSQTLTLCRCTLRCTLSTNSSDLNTTRQLLARLKAQDVAPLFHIPLWHSQLPKHTTLLCPAGFTDLPILCLLKLLWEISSKINVLS